MASNRVDDLSWEDRQSIGDILAGYVDDWEADIAQAKEWWRQVEELYYGMDATEAISDDGEETGVPIDPRPLSAPRQNSLVDQIAATVTKQRPYMLDTSEDTMVADGKGELVHRVWADANFPQRVRQVGRITTNTDLAFLRLTPLGNDRIEFFVVHPRDLCIFPALPTGREDAVMIGHRINKTRRYIQKMRSAGVYYDDPFNGSNVLAEHPADRENENPAIERSGAKPSTGGHRRSIDRIVEVWDVWVRLDLTDLEGGEEWTGKNEKVYHATFCRDDRTLLYLEPYAFSTPWYFETRLMGADQFYPATSVARELAPLQKEYSRLWSMHYDAVMAAAMPPVFGPELDEKITSYQSGAYIPADGQAGAYFSPPSKADVAQIPNLLDRCERNADKTCGVSENTAGAAIPQQTATAAQIIAAGVSVRLEGYIETFTQDFPRMAALTGEIIATNFDAFARKYNVVETPPPSAPDPAASAPDGAPAPFSSLHSALMAGAPGMAVPTMPPVMPGADPLGTGDNGGQP